jgi:hypothetical protein
VQAWRQQRRPEIANAPNAAARKRLIGELAETDAALYDAFKDDIRKAEGESHFVRNGGLYPLCGRGDINTYAIFAEANRNLLSERGRVGCIVPSGIATDDTTKEFFQSLVQSAALVSLYDFQSGPGLFAEVGHARFKFCLLTLSGAEMPHGAAAEFAFFLRDVEHLRESERRFKLTAAEIALLNPNTQTCPIFRSQHDAELTKAIYRRVPVLINEREANGNPWSISFMRLLDMANDSGLFRTREQLMGEGWLLRGNRFVCSPAFRRTVEYDEAELPPEGGTTNEYLPLYEAKMLHHFDHRYGDYNDKPEDSQNTSLPEVPVERLQRPDYVVQPRYWVPREAVIDKITRVPADVVKAFRTGADDDLLDAVQAWLTRYELASETDEELRERASSTKALQQFIERRAAARQGLAETPLTGAEAFRLRYSRDLHRDIAELIEAKAPRWLLGWRDICRSTDERTVIASVLPSVGVGDKFLLMFPRVNPAETLALLGCLDSFVFDYNARQKVGGTALKYFTMRQLPMLPPSTYAQPCAWSPGQALREWLAPRLLELTYTAHDLRGFAEDCGYPGEPFRWDEARRFRLRCELDAAYFHLYGIEREDVAYILDTFPIVRRKDIERHDEYRTQRVILELYDALQQAMTTGQPYQTRLDPPPAYGWTPEESRDEGGGMRDEVGAAVGAGAEEPFPLQMEDARPQPGLFDELG